MVGRVPASPGKCLENWLCNLPPGDVHDGALGASHDDESGVAVEYRVVHSTLFACFITEVI